MKKKLIIFGTGDIAELAQFYFDNDSEYKVVAFTVDQAYLKSKFLNGLPVIAFETLHQDFAPSDYTLFIALSYSELNKLRKEKYLQAKSMGYQIASYVSSKASIFNTTVGENCFILEDNTIQPFVTIGDNVTLWSGNHIGHHSVIGDHTFIASQVVISGGVNVGDRCFIGVNATLRDHISIGDECVIGAGVLLLSDAESKGVYLGKEAERSRVPSNRLRNL